MTIDASSRGLGLGSSFIHAIEAEAATAKHKNIYLTVDPVTNPRAYALFKRLGYEGIRPSPREIEWSFEDSNGNRYGGKDTLLDMFKEIS